MCCKQSKAMIQCWGNAEQNRLSRDQVHGSTEFHLLDSQLNERIIITLGEKPNQQNPICHPILCRSVLLLRYSFRLAPNRGFIVNTEASIICHHIIIVSNTWYKGLFKHQGHFSLHNWMKQEAKGQVNTSSISTLWPVYTCMFQLRFKFSLTSLAAAMMPFWWRPWCRI